MNDSVAQNLAAFHALAVPRLAVIDGRDHVPLSGETFDNIAPRDNRLIAEVAACGPADIDLAVAAGRRAFDAGTWRTMSPGARKKILFRLADLMEAEAEELALLETIDTGKPIFDSRRVDVADAIKTLRWYAEALDKIYGEVAPSPHGRLSLVEHEPLGVIGVIVPWNFPLLMTMWKIAPALAMGNSVVLKPAEQSPSTAIRLGQLAREAGLPDGVLNVVPGLGGTAGKAMALHMDVDMIAFTGSGPVGKLLMQYSGQSNLKRVSLELGGKSPQIVFADCPDMDAAVFSAAWGIMFNQGEVCTAASRLLVERSIRDEFAARVVEWCRTIKMGDPLDPATRFGAMVSEAQMARALGYIGKGREEGANLLLGGNRALEESGGFFIEPTIFSEVAPESTLAREEIFGPVLSIMSFDDEADAVRIANDTIYGLGSGLWSADINKALRVAKAIRAGMVWVNGWDSDDITVPFGGFKQSGFGRDRSLHAMQKYADLKSISITIAPGRADTAMVHPLQQEAMAAIAAGQQQI